MTYSIHSPICESKLCQNLPCFLRPFSFVPKSFDAGVRLSVLEDIVEYRCELKNLQIRAFLFFQFLSPSSKRVQCGFFREPSRAWDNTSLRFPKPLSEEVPPT